MTDAEWVNQIADENYDYIANYARKLVRRCRLPNADDLAAELTQMVFITLYEQVSEKGLRQHENIVAWMKLTLRNKLGSYFQKHSNREIPVADVSVLRRAPALTFEISEPFPPGMTSDERDLLYRYYVLSIPNQEIAASLGIEPGACYMRIVRARARFRELYLKQQVAEARADIDENRRKDWSMLDKGGVVHA